MRTDLRFLLIQARNPDDPVREEERAAFAERIGIGVDQIESADMLEGPIDIERLQDVDCVLVGGSGEYSVLDDHDGIRGGIRFLGLCADRGFPTFASCFGFQALVIALGGTVIRDGDNAEVGTYTITLNDAGRADPVFAHMPDRFAAQEGHKDRASRLPDGAVNLALTAAAPFQALRIGEQPVYATQFHPELTGPAQAKRFERYWDHYAHHFGKEEARRLLESFAPSPEACGLMARFVEVVFP